MKKLLIGIVSLLVVFAVWSVAASESGEVVILTTRDAAGQPSETRVWVVEHEGVWYLRAGDPASTWLARIRTQPEVQVERAGNSATYLAIPEPDERDAINDLMRQKYGWADASIAFMFGRDDATPIRLQPNVQSGSATGGTRLE